jgi:hypothetical protein
VQASTAAKPPLPQPILPSPTPRPAAIQPAGGQVFALPATFNLRSSGTGARLPEVIQRKMEAFFGTSFDDVRVHVGSEAAAIGSLAFTHGSNLYFAPGQYNPQTPQGQRLLGHELTHVVQQRAGRVRNPLGQGVAVVHDPALEAEAERMGQRLSSMGAVVQPKRPEPKLTSTLGGSVVSRPILAAARDSKLSGVPVQPRTAAIQPAKVLAHRGVSTVQAQPIRPRSRASVVQRLMSPTDFENETKVAFGFRYYYGLSSIDKALSTYTSLGWEKFTERKQQLAALDKECAVVLASGASEETKAGVRRLREQIAVEKTYVDPATEAHATANLTTKARLLMQALDAFVEAKRRFHPPPTVYDLTIDHLHKPIIRLINQIKDNNNDELKPLIMKDLDELRRMRDDSTTPLVTRRALAEILANVDKVLFDEDLSGARLVRPHTTNPYTVLHNLSQPGGTVERIGSMAHELTHVSVSEQFCNTVLFFAYAVDATEGELKQFVKERSEQVARLEKLLIDDVYLQYDQKSLVESKLAYAKGNSLTKYAGDFLRAGKIDKATHDKVKEMAIFANNTIIEFDPVVNQILVYMHSWKIKQNSPFYAELLRIAERALDYRTAFHKSRDALLTT